MSETRANVSDAMLSVAPMMDWTDRHCRFFLRLLTRHSLLYTEMVTAAALTHGDRDRLLRFDPAEHPVALQLGGSDPQMMTDAAVMGAEAGYDEININVGCPSDRVKSGQFGACLMAQPERVAACVSAMRSAVDVPVTVKTRIGIDEHDSDDYLFNFVEQVRDGGCETFIVHARIAILAGLSPKENRSIPPLNYERVYRLKERWPELRIVLNGGITSTADIDRHLQHVDAAMIGRQAYHDPWFLSEAEEHLAGSRPLANREAAVHGMQSYVQRELASGVPLKHISRHMLGLFAGQPGARAWRRYLSENAHKAGSDFSTLAEALASFANAA